MLFLLANYTILILMMINNLQLAIKSNPKKKKLI